MTRTLSSLMTVAALAVAPSSIAVDADRAANTVILDETAVANLKIKTVEVSEETFESIVFAIGRIEEFHSRHSVLSSRIPGRITAVYVHEGDLVEAGDVLALVESRQPGNPPPTVELKALQGGIVVESKIRLGEPVEPDVDLIDIADRSVLWAIAKIPETEIAQISVGSRARIRIPALGEQVIEATLTRFGVEADRSAGTIEGIFEIDNADGHLQPGMRAEFAIITSRREDVMSVPRSAIQGDPTKRVVFVEDFELPHAYVRAPIVLGEQNDTHVEVIRGLFPGDEVVTTGSYALSFAGSGSGMSLKEALDAAHGHEHNEDGSEMTDEQKAAKADTGKEANNSSSLVWWVFAWAIAATLAAAYFAQRGKRLREGT